MIEIPKEGIRLGGEPVVPNLGPGMDIPPRAMAFLSDPQMWRNWEDVELAKAEEMLRDWIERMCEIPSWRSTRSKKRRYTFSMLFELVTGERYEQRKHAKYIRTWTTLFRYYSSRIQNAASIDGKMYSKTIYVISPKRLERPPYSLRLRIPWLVEHGMAIDQRTMTNPQSDVLRPGHARNPRTEESMRRRREEMRRRYNERYRDRKH